MSRRQTTSSDDDDDAANVSGSHSNRKLGTKGDEGKETGKFDGRPLVFQRTF